MDDIMALAHALSDAGRAHAQASASDSNVEVHRTAAAWVNAEKALRFALEDLSKHVKAPEDGYCWCGCPNAEQMAFCVDCGRDLSKVRAGIYTVN